MSTFAQLAALQTPGVAWLLQASSDGFSTVAYQFGTVAGKLDGSVMCDPRIKGLGNLTRSLGARGALAMSTVDFTLDNIDGGVDWLCDQSSFATVFKMRFRLYCYLYDPSNPSDSATKLLGRFSCTEQPQRTGDAVALSLGDATAGDLASLVRTPSVNDWLGITDANRPAALSNPTAVGSLPGFDFDTPLPLLFGTGWLPLTRVQRNTYVICAVAGSAGALAMGIDGIATKSGRVLPATIALTTPPQTTATVWQVRRTPDITVDGKTWHLLWVEVDLTGTSTPATNVEAIFLSGYYTADEQAALEKTSEVYAVHDIIGPLMVRGYLLSQTVNAAADMNSSIGAATIARNIIEAYSAGLAAGDVASAGFSAQALAHPDATASGVLAPTTRAVLSPGREVMLELTGGEVRSTLASLADLGNFDLAFNWAGQVVCISALADFAALTTPISALDETLISRIDERVPGSGERWAPYNALYVQTSDGLFGPFVDTDAVTAWGRTIARTVDASWMAWGHDLYGGRVTTFLPNPSRFRNRQTGKIRPCLTVETWLNGFDFELGDYLTLAWSRGLLGTPYAAGTVWRVEGITVALGSAAIRLELVWVNDLTSSSSLPYLLDTEALLTRSTGSAGRTATVFDGSAVVTFSSGSLTTDGVAAGDMLVVTDTTEAATTFLRNRVVRVASVDSATQLTYAGSTSWGTGASSVAVESWKIQRGALTYHTAATDPTNYPSGGTMYGKVSDSAQATFFSNGTTKANLLLEG